MLPEITKIGSFTLSGYDFFYILGVLFSFIVIFILSRNEKLDLIEILNFLIFGAISGIAGAKLYGILVVFVDNPGLYLTSPPKLLKSLNRGGIFYGGMIAITIFMILYARRYFKGSEWKVFDITVIGGALGHMFGRLGCFSAGCCYGVPTDLPWGVKFPFQGGKPHPFSDIFVHPTQIYEATLNLLNFLILLVIWRKKKFDGQIISLYLINYGIIRFVIEFLRNDGGRGYLIESSSKFLSFSIPQLISILLVITGFYLYKKLNSKIK